MIEIDSSAIVLVMEGNLWCATRPDFINGMESPAGFGKTITEAVDALLLNEMVNYGTA